jgi:FHA domain
MEAVLQGPTGRIILGTTVLTIGRVPGSDITMTDPQSSGRHAEIRPEGQGYSIVDLGSTNGTYVNEQKLAPHAPRTLYADDRIRIGTTPFTFEVSGIAPIAPTVFANQPLQGTEFAFPETVAVPPPAYAREPRGYQAPPPSFTTPAAPFNPALPIPPKQKPKKKRRGMRGVVIFIIVVLLLAVVTYGAVTYLNRSTPQKTLTAFCNDLNANDYHGAYQQMSNNFQSTTSEEKFTRFLKGQFALGGGLKNCQSNNIATSGATGTATLAFTVNSALVPQQNRNSTLVTDNGVWKIESIAQK